MIGDKFLGSMLWSAIGDAVGSGFEFHSMYNIQSEIDRVIKEKGVEAAVSDFILKRGITDDTMMSLYQARSLIEKRVFDPADTASKFVVWVDSGERIGGIGKTTAAAIGKLRRGVAWDAAGQTGKMAAGNGCSMRISPVALFYHLDPVALASHCINSSRITHNCEEAFAGTRAVAYAVMLGLHGGNVPDNLLLQSAVYAGESDTADKLKRAYVLLGKGVPTVTALQEIGCGGYVAENAAAALYCVASHPTSPIEAIMAAVNAGGDTDTTAAVVGAISGAWNGVGNIPPQWLEALGYVDRLTETAEQLYSVWQEEYHG